MSQFKATFTLKQHTPLIHFQSDQSGATLRATELKPKLDSFLLEHVKDIPFKTNANGHRSLDYKVKIYSQTIENNLKYMTYIPKKDREKKNLKLGSYFGDYDAVQLKNIKVEFFSFNKNVLEAINKYFDEFISISTYGTRSNKGFGDFTNIKTNQKSFEENLKKHYVILNIKTDKQPLKMILKDYQVLKSGGMNGVKSKLMEYFFKESIRWEKRWIKRKLKEKQEEWFNDLKDEYHESNDFNFQENEKYFFLRVLFGLAENNEFLVNSSNTNKLIVKIENIDVDEDDKILIERFPSPLIFKVFDNSIYFLLDKNEPIKQDIFNKSFRFTAYYKNNKRNQIELGTLSTPSSFDIEKFLKEVL